MRDMFNSARASWGDWLGGESDPTSRQREEKDTKTKYVKCIGQILVIIQNDCDRETGDYIADHMALSLNVWARPSTQQTNDSSGILNLSRAITRLDSSARQTCVYFLINKR